MSQPSHTEHSTSPEEGTMDRTITGSERLEALGLVTLLKGAVRDVNRLEDALVRRLGDEPNRIDSLDLDSFELAEQEPATYLRDLLERARITVEEEG
jgi:hypothetical protein